MNVFEAIEQRRSAKHYLPDVHIPESDVHKIIRAGMLAPTSFNIQHWRFVRIRDRAIRQALYQAAFVQSQVKDASELLVITGDKKAWKKRPERYWREADAPTTETIVNMLTAFYQGKPQLQEHEVIRSGALAAQNMMLAAQALGYSSCPMIGFNPEEVANIIRLPRSHCIVMLLALGKACLPPKPRGGQLALHEVLLENHFS